MKTKKSIIALCLVAVLASSVFALKAYEPHTTAQKQPRLTLRLSAERARWASVQSVIPTQAHTVLT